MSNNDIKKTFDRACLDYDTRVMQELLTQYPLEFDKIERDSRYRYLSFFIHGIDRDECRMGADLIFNHLFKQRVIGPTLRAKDMRDDGADDFFNKLSQAAAVISILNLAQIDGDRIVGGCIDGVDNPKTASKLDIFMYALDKSKNFNEKQKVVFFEHLLKNLPRFFDGDCVAYFVASYDLSGEQLIGVLSHLVYKAGDDDEFDSKTPLMLLGKIYEIDNDFQLVMPQEIFNVPIIKVLRQSLEVMREKTKLSKFDLGADSLIDNRRDSHTNNKL